MLDGVSYHWQQEQHQQCFCFEITFEEGALDSVCKFGDRNSAKDAVWEDGKMFDGRWLALATLVLGLEPKMQFGGRLGMWMVAVQFPPQ